MQVVHSIVHFIIMLYNRTTELTPICLLKEGVMPHLLEKDPFDTEENRRRAGVQSSSCFKIQ